MKRILFIALILNLVFSLSAQDFFRNDFNKRKKYVILTNPTVGNIETVRYLENTRLLDINTRKTKFVGVYFEHQNYDFSKTKQYIEKNKLKNFFLHEVHGELDIQNIFEENDCTDDIETIFTNSVGIFFFGGPDIPSDVYEEEDKNCEVTDRERHYFETTFLFHLLGSYRNENQQALLQQKPHYLITGFCLGLQTMNVATGGTLIQDIPAEIYGAETPESTLKTGRANLHRNYWHKVEDDTLLMYVNLHTIQFAEHPFFGDVVDVPRRWKPRVYSSHHQAAENLGKGMVVTAWSPDGKIVEGLAHQQFPNVFAVQFHPEVPALYEDMYVRKFHPEDEPMSYNDIIGRQSVKFHERYWEHISRTIKKAKR